MSTTLRIIVGTAIVAVILTIALQFSKPKLPSKPIALLACADTSGSHREQLQLEASLLADIVLSLDQSDRVQLYRLDDTLRQFFDSHPSESRDELTALLVNSLSPRSREKGSRLDLLLVELVKSLQAAHHPVVIMIFSDFIPDGMTGDQLGTYRSCVGEVAKSPNLAGLVLVGVSNTTWIQTKSDYVAVRNRVGGDRFLMIEAGKSEISPVYNLLQAARNSPVTKGAAR